MKRQKREIRNQKSRKRKTVFLISHFSFLIPLFLFYILVSTIAFAAETVSLSSLIEEAKKNNPEILAYQKRVKAKEHRAKIEGVIDDPQFKVEVMDIPGDKPFNLGDSMQTRYTFSQMFPFPGKLSLKQKTAMKEVFMAASEARNRELAIVTMFKEAYFDYAYMVESINITKELKAIVSQMTDIAAARYAANLVSQQDIIKAQLELTMLQNELIYVEAEKDIATARMNAVLNRDSAAPIGEPEDIKAYQARATQGLIVELQRIAIEKSPSLKAMEYDIQARDAEIDLNKKNYYPDFMVGVAPIQRDGRFDAWDLMFSVNIPLWWGKYDNQVSEARANADVLRTRIWAEQNMKIFEVRQAAIKFYVSERVRNIYETAILPQAEISFQSAFVNYQTGKVDFLTMLDAERALKKTRIDYIKSVVEYRKNIALLEKAVGEDFESGGKGQGARGKENAEEKEK